VLAGLGVLAKVFFHAAPPADETLLGCAIGDPRDEVMAKLKVFHSPRDDVKDPWALPLPPYLGHVLRAADLGLPPEAVRRLEVQPTADSKVCAIFHEDRLRALVVQEPHAATTARNVRIGAHAGKVIDAYPEAPSEDRTVSVPGEGPEKTKTVEVRRYDALGLGFEMLEGKVRAITLYPPVKP
jgi:hypothetical protein